MKLVVFRLANQIPDFSVYPDKLDKLIYCPDYNTDEIGEVCYIKEPYHRVKLCLPSEKQSQAPIEISKGIQYQDGWCKLTDICVAASTDIRDPSMYVENNFSPFKRARSMKDTDARIYVFAKKLKTAPIKECVNVFWKDSGVVEYNLTNTFYDFRHPKLTWTSMHTPSKMSRNPQGCWKSRWDRYVRDETQMYDANPEVDCIELKIGRDWSIWRDDAVWSQYKVS